MTDRMQRLTAGDLSRIHDASMDILNRAGMDFSHDEVAHIFHSHGFRTSGTRVFFTESEILQALATTLPEFRVHARNPQFSVTIGGEGFVMNPSGGATHIAGPTGIQRPATYRDFQDCCRLVQTSDQVDMGGVLMVQPMDVPADTANLDMLFSYMTLCDKPIFGASCNGRQARESLEMAAILFGGPDKLLETPRVVAVSNTFSPLRISRDQADVIVQMARFRQPVVVSNMVLGGVTGPVTLPELLALINAEILAGITLTQLVSPGAPVIYGSCSAPIDMRTMVSAVGCREAIQIASATIQMAGLYHLPCRTGGSLTDAHLPDAQALAEGSLMLSTVVRNGAHFIYHACGQMGSYISMGFEKWLLDEEVCRLVRGMMAKVMRDTEPVDADLVIQVGIGGQYLTHPDTFRKFRNLSETRLFNRKDYSRWQKAGALDAAQKAGDLLSARLSAYCKPPLDPALESALARYVAERKTSPSCFAEPVC